VSGGTNGEEFGQSLHDPKNDGLNIRAQEAPSLQLRFTRARITEGGRGLLLVDTVHRNAFIQFVHQSARPPGII
jgi:hypothetical protein